MVKNKLNKKLVYPLLSFALSMLSIANVNADNSVPAPHQKAKVYKDYQQAEINKKYLHAVDLDSFLKYKPSPHPISSRVQLMRKVKTNNGWQNRPHKGTDFASPVGTQLRAVADGVVIFNKINGGGRSQGFGLYTGIEHPGGYRTLYAHLDKFMLNPGEKVKAGDVVGVSGATGNISGPHLHFELTYNGFTVDAFPKDGVPPDYGDGLPRIDYGYPVDSDGRQFISNVPMPIINPITAFDCDSLEVANYMSQLNYSNPKGMTNVPTVVEIEPAILKSKEIEYGAEANECLTIFNDGSFEDGIEKAKDLWNKMQDFISNPVAGLTDAAKQAADRAKETFEAAQKQYQKGICKRMNSAAKKTGDMLGHELATFVASGSNSGGSYISGKSFENISLNNIEILAQKELGITREDLVANHFTYLIAQNLMSKGSKDVSSVLKLNSKNYSEYLERFGIDFIDGKISDLEDIVFGS